MKLLPPGIYDQPITEALAKALASVAPANIQRGKLDPERAAIVLARMVHDRTVRAFQSIKGTGAEKLDGQQRLANRLIELLAADPETGAVLDDRFQSPVALLLAVLEQVHSLASAPPPERPIVPLSSSDLLVNSRHDVRIGSEIVREMASADRVDLLCSFLKWSGFRIIEPALKSLLARRPGRFRVLTTAYMGATERRALDALVALGADVRVSYDVEHTRLHAKAWLFHRESGFSTAFIGSSNLSHAAMLDGLEWNVRLSQIDNGGILDKFRAVFEQYWDQGDFEAYDPTRDRNRWDEAVRRQAESRSSLLLAIRVEPKQHQAEILEQLDAERDRGHTRNLVVAATGTGKTVIAALDYKRLRSKLGPQESLLFVAHRHEILEQSRTLFRVVLGDPVFGERLGSGEVPRAGEHVFANVQSLDLERLSTLAPDAYDMVIIDEFHHAAADSYTRLLRHLRPRFLLGLTATPERTDGRSVLEWFDGRIASELRLWKALDQGLLAPFQYFGTSDGTSLRDVKWTPKGYDPAGLRGVYMAGDFWVKRVLAEVAKRIADPSQMRALGFCVDVAHAEFMAERFTAAGLRSTAVTQATPARDREAALRALRSGELRVLFSVDLFNEGVDLPDVDTILFLRPTESATVFLQQLGRGLRRSDDKECLTVLDFIGNASRKFRFDSRFRALLGGTRRQIQNEVELDFPRLPAGCSIQLDAVAKQSVLDNIKEALGIGDQGLVDDLREIGDVPLPEFLRLAGVDLDDVYSRSGRTFERLRRRAGFAPAQDDENGDELSRGVARMLHIDDEWRLRAFGALLAATKAPKPDPSDPAQRMLFAALGLAQDPLSELGATWAALWGATPIRNELRALLGLLEDRRGRTFALDGRMGSTPLRTHGTYSLDEVMAALDERDAKGRIKRLREGVFHCKQKAADLLFVTLEKSEDEYSPSTMYRDYPISVRRFHWESQSFIHEDTSTGRRYIGHVKARHQILLFVRRRKEARPGITAPYVMLGPVRYARHTGGRPMSIEWEIDRPMPAELFQETKVAAG